MPDGIQLAIAFALGGLLGLLIGWLLGRGRVAPADDRLADALRQQLTGRDNELSSARKELAVLHDKLSEVKVARAALETALQKERESATEKLGLINDAQTKLADAFTALSSKALQANNQSFLDLAQTKLAELQNSAKGDLEKRQEAIEGLVKPLKQQLDAYQTQLQQSDRAQSGALGEVKKQLETLAQRSQSLADETQQFRMVLKSNQARGRWGEETLRRVVEAAGMSAHCDFAEQSKGDEGKPDLIVRLPGERVIIVDAKVPDLDFLSASAAAEPAKRADALATHAAKLKATIKALADRDYPSQFPNALDYVVLFLPAESLFSAALEGDQELIVWAAGNRILLATPASLIALLRSVSVSWQQHAQTENAREIAATAQELFERVVTFTKHLENIRGGLEAANKAFNQAVGSYESRVRPSGEKLQKLGGGAPGKELADVQPLDATLRLPPGNG
jgi:DNA recombination protein RmuC